MPRLVLFDDNGRELFAGDISRQNVFLVARFIRKHMPTFRALAAMKQAWVNVTGKGRALEDLGRSKGRRR